MKIVYLIHTNGFSLYKTSKLNRFTSNNIILISKPLLKIQSAFISIFTSISYTSSNIDLYNLLEIVYECKYVVKQSTDNFSSVTSCYSQY